MRTPHDVSRRTGKPVATGLAAIVIGASAFIGGTAVPAIAAPAAPAAPAPGVPHDPVVLIREDFEQDGANATIRGLDTYTGANGETYTADASWLQDCNGWLSRGSHPDNAATQVTDCANQNGWNAVQRLSIALGLNDGLSSSAALENIGVAAYTQDNPTTGRMLESVTPLVVPVTGRYVTMSVDTAVVNCFAAHPSLRFELTPTGGSAITVANNLDPCNQPAVTGTIPTIGVNSTASSDFRVGTVTGKASTKVTASEFGVRLSNNTLTGGGNDFAFDNLTILDVTRASITSSSTRPSSRAAPPRSASRSPTVPSWGRRRTGVSPANSRPASPARAP